MTRVWGAQEIFEGKIAARPMPIEFVTRRDHERDLKIARQVTDDGLPLHFPQYDHDRDRWGCWCEDKKCLWNRALDSARRAGYLYATALLIDNTEYLDGDDDGSGITNTDLPARAGQAQGHGEVLPVRESEGVSVAPPQDQEGER